MRMTWVTVAQFGAVITYIGSCDGDACATGSSGCLGPVESLLAGVVVEALGMTVSRHRDLLERESPMAALGSAWITC